MPYTIPPSLGDAFNQVIAKSADFTILSSQNGALFNVTTGNSNVTATLPTGAQGLFFFIRKADAGTGGVLNSASSGGLFISGHMTLLAWNAGTSAWIGRAWFGSENTSGALTVSSGGSNQNINLNPSGSGIVSSTGQFSGTGYVGVNRSYNAPTAISAAGDTSIALQAGEITRAFVVTVQAGAGTYSATLSLASTNAVAGAIITATIAMPASLNPTLTIKNLTSGGATLGNPIFGRAIVRTWELEAQFDGTNWFILALRQTVFTPISVDFDYAISTAQDATGGSGSAWAWTIPAGAQMISIIACGPGNGGASGRKSSVLTAGGGGGGASGNVAMLTIPVSALASSVLAITIPLGGVGGASQTTDVNNGNPGIDALAATNITAGGVQICNAGLNNGTVAGGGLIGAGGAGGLTDTSRAGNFIAIAGGLGGFAGAGANGTTINVNTSSGFASGPGGGGGGLNTTATAGGRGGLSSSYNSSTVNGGAATGAPGTAGSAANNAAQGYGIGGGGGGGNAAGTGGVGGAGYRGGGGGGGGGSSGNSGAGGNGGDGFVRIIVT